ncbi:MULTISPECIES: hypothetical protein [Pseudomonas syringae group]|uniref:hypothetical protein n=1 Tax=Pseudomonas syringae group TaxID=136849 RepID=UPI000A5BDEAA|nr:MULTISPECIES: hypothetical protein [Pseudomonas syringae group]
MTLIVMNENQEEYAPYVFFNHCGAMPWSSRHASEFTGAELVELLDFCREEGHRQGLNDANQDRIGLREVAPFHVEFLRGYPKRAWEEAYWIGVHEHGDLTNEEIDHVINQVLADPSTSRWLQTSLKSALSLDCVDSLNDAQCLTDLLTRRFNAIAMSSTEQP